MIKVKFNEYNAKYISCNNENINIGDECTIKYGNNICKTKIKSIQKTPIGYRINFMNDNHLCSLLVNHIDYIALIK